MNMIQPKILPNGLRVISYPIQSTKAITVLVYVGAGSRLEQEKERGMAHFLEHILFEGSHKFKNRQAINEAMGNIGGWINAFTDKEYTCFQAKAAGRDIDLLLSILSDMLLHPNIDENKIIKEKEVVFEELNDYKNNTSAHTYFEFEKLIFGEHPLGRDILGNKKQVAEITREMLLKFKNDFYVAENILIVAVGDFEERIMISKIENYFKFPRQRLTRHCEKFVSQNNLPSVFLNNKETDQSIIVYGFPALPVISHRKYAFDIVSLILGGGAASRMYLKISNELGLCYEIGTDNFSFSDTGVFSIYAYTSSKKLLPAIKAIRDEYARMFAEGITLKELKRAKNYFRGSYAINFEDSYEVARFLGDQAVSLGYAETPDEDMLKTEKVTRREVNSLIRELFDPVRARLAVTTDLGGSRGKVLKMKGELQEIIGG